MLRKISPRGGNAREKNLTRGSLPRENRQPPAFLSAGSEEPLLSEFSLGQGSMNWADDKAADRRFTLAAMSQ